MQICKNKKYINVNKADNNIEKIGGNFVSVWIPTQKTITGNE